MYIRLSEDVQGRLLNVLCTFNLRPVYTGLCCSYNPDSSNTKSHFLRLSVSIDIHSSQYEHITDMADLNVEVEIGTWENSWKNYNLKRLIRVPQCYQNPNNPSTIDLIKSNCQRSFQTSCAIETGGSLQRLLKKNL